MPEVRANGVSLYYEEYGAGEPIVGIHGTGSSVALWESAAGVLGQHGRAIVYDRRGFGRSAQPSPFATDVHQQADDAAALIDALDAAPAIVIGRSQGGEIAVDLALRYPDRVRALALLEGGALALGPQMQEWLADVDEQVFAAAEADIDTVGETMIRAVLGDEGWEAWPAEVQEIFTANGPGIAAEHRGGLLDVTPDELRSIAHPTLIVGGKESGPAFAEVTNLMAASMPNAEVEWVEAGHVIDAAHPVVLGFVDRVLARPLL